MYRVKQLDNESWAIVDRGDATLFVGTMRQCEDWLDHRQNMDRLANRISLWKRIVRWVWRCCSRKRAEPSGSDSNRPANRPGAATSRSVESSSEVESSPAA